MKYVEGRKYVVYTDVKSEKPYMREKRDKNNIPVSIPKIVSWLKERNGILAEFINSTKEVPNTVGDSSDSQEEEEECIGLSAINM